MRKSKRIRQGLSLGTIVMFILTFAVVAGFSVLLPSFTGNQDILFDATRLAVAMDDSLAQLSASTGEIIQNYIQPQSTFLPPFASQTASRNQNNALLIQTAAITPVPTPTPNPKRTFTLCAAGSIEVDNNVRKAMTIDKTLHFDLLTDQMNQKMQADLSIATLKNTVSASAALSNVNTSPELLKAIRSMGVNALNIANSNMFNSGIQGVSETRSAVQACNMEAIGTKEPAILSLNDVSVALLHFQDKLSSSSLKQTTESERSGLVSPVDLAEITADIASARTSGAEIVVVTLYWGEDGKHTPTDTQRIQAQAIADAGADIILGTGNGALQPVQVLSANRGDGKYHPVLCAYSLGNLFSPERDTRITLAGMLLKTQVIYDSATQTAAFENITYTPTYAWRGKDDGKTLQRILINDPSNLPDFVDQNQQSVMERCMTLTKDVMADTAIPLAY